MLLLLIIWYGFFIYLDSYYSYLAVLQKSLIINKVTYSFNQDGEIEILGNNLSIEADNKRFYTEFLTGPMLAFTSDIPFDKVTVKGNGNIITGSYENDSVKVIGDNNEIDLKDGIDTANIIGDNNDS